MITSRKPNWPRSLGVQALPLGILAPGESVALLHQHRADLSASDPDLVAIAKELGHLPLALHLAGSYLEHYRHASFGNPAVYLAELRRSNLLEHTSLIGGDTSPTGHELHVANTFALSWRRLDPENQVDVLGRSVLVRATCFAPGEPIPRELLKASFKIKDGDANAERQVEDGISRALELGLLEERADGALTLHRLLAAFVRREAAAERPDALDAVEEAVFLAASRLNQQGYPAPLTAWRPHLRTVAEAAAERESEGGARLLNELGVHLSMVAEYSGARAAFERALAIDKKTFGPEHPNVAIRVNNLGLVLRALGDLDGARAAHERALAMDEKTLGPDHPNVAIRLNNLGLVLRALGDLEGARASYERALAIFTASLPADHPDIRTVRGNLNSLDEQESQKKS